MATITLGGENFEETLKSGGILLVDFWAAWCGPCRMFAPVFETASEAHADIIFGKVDTEEEQALAGAAQIQSIPTLMAFRDGVLVYREAGALPASALGALIEQIQALDMDAIRAQIAAGESDAAPAETVPVEA